MLENEVSNKTWIATFLSSTTKNWSKAFSRFPIFIIVIAFFCGYLSYLQSTNVSHNERISMPMILALGGIFFTYLFNENFQIKSYKKWIGFGLAGLLAIGFYFILPEVPHYRLRWTYITFTSLLFIFHLMYAVIPFFRNKDEEMFLRYNVNVLEAFAESILLNMILYGLLCLAIYAVKTLFDLGFDNDLFMHLFIWIAGFINTINFLSNYPDIPINKATQNKYNSRFYKILVQYIGIPVMIIYGVIILAYTIKIAVGSDFKPWITSMCAWYISIGLLVYLLNRLYLKDNIGKVAKSFDQYFPIASLPVVLLFAYSAWKNINQSGITIEYYYLTLMVVFSLVVFILMSLKKDFDLRWFPYILIGLAVFSILPGSWNSWTLPVKNQEKRLISMLKENGWIENETLNLDQKPIVKNAAQIEQTIYNIESFGNLNILNKYDKNKLLRDTMMAYELIEKLKLQSYNTPKAMDNKYYESLPVIDVLAGQKIYPIINKYVAAKADYTGIRVSDSGKMVVYEKGVASDSMILNIDQINNQKISISTLIEKDTFDFYIQNLAFEKKGNDCKVEDLVGLVIRR
jgi:hypothetical protein